MWSMEFFSVRRGEEREREWKCEDVEKQRWEQLSWMYFLMERKTVEEWKYEDELEIFEDLEARSMWNRDWNNYLGGVGK